ncbi:threonine-phosphate decarboxylase [Candidatus Atribacteria bacterium 4572_76]|nr:MAG: threonine-phosphate decarboxylase [Candidatus Atribacteria bacterium 4572_76]
MAGEEELFKHLHGGNLERAMEKYGISSEKIIDFSANINPLGFSSKIREAIIKNLDQLSHYPDPECKKAKKEISGYFKIDYENILLGNGSTELIYLIVQTIKPKKALIPVPTFCEYERALNNNNVSINFYKLKEKQEFLVSIDEITPRLAGIDLVFLCNPNNPTGTFLPKKEILNLVKEVQKRKIFLVLDEAFIDLYEEDSLIKEVKNYNYLIILRSLTKFYGLPGLRIGFAASSPKLIKKLDPKLIKKLETQKIPWSVNSLAQIAVREVLRDEKYISKSRSFLLKEKKFLYRELSNIKGLKAYKPSANFIFIKLLKNISSEILQNHLGRKGILIRNCSNFRGLEKGKFIRVAVRTRKENIKLLKELKLILR